MSVASGQGRRLRVNIALWVLVILCGAAATWAGMRMVDQYRSDGGDTSGNVLERTVAVIADRQPTGEEAGAALGARTVKAVDEAPESEQERSAAILQATSAIATAFVNLDFDAVRTYATGAFQTQWDKSVKSLVKMTERAQSEMEGEVLWSGIVDSDDDSATVIAATTGSVKNKVTKFQPQARNYRLQMELVLKDRLWLVRDLQFVA
ncbi:hypothetical protein E8D34_15140 [Nocardioides sp. GY 10113]|uniref:hypothetical protein n=1 Tax=Nocardioides sp. GY 10113 TaxID=2569761 RepID=UPI0010A931DB|nr:hypothetical protein [Nocardioides sp. GY 10113]TIC83889.1 hypothetical protein E8D34_15140 [Nocardioides sp. GY 10113]